MSGSLILQTQPNGFVRPLKPYPTETTISAHVLDLADARWSHPLDPGVLVFAEDCQYRLVKYVPERGHFEMRLIT